MVKPLVTRSSIFYTDDVLLAKNINFVHNLKHFNSKEEYLENASDLEKNNGIADDENFSQVNLNIYIVKIYIKLRNATQVLLMVQNSRIVKTMKLTLKQRNFD